MPLLAVCSLIGPRPGNAIKRDKTRENVICSDSASIWMAFTHSLTVLEPGSQPAAAFCGRSRYRMIWCGVAWPQSDWFGAVPVAVAVAAKKYDTFSICACHPCAGAMLIFSVSFQFLRMTGCDPGSDPIKQTPTKQYTHTHSTRRHLHQTHQALPTNHMPYRTVLRMSIPPSPCIMPIKSVLLLLLLHSPRTLTHLHLHSLPYAVRRTQSQ